MLKLSISLVVVYLFYQFVLRRLTFYNWNRWYLVSYSLMSFFIPFIDISVVLERNEWEQASIVNWVPNFTSYSSHPVPLIRESPGPSSGFILGVVVLAGMIFMLLRLLVQLYSFRRMIKKAQWIPAEGMNIYQINEPIIPFSFGNSIFINQNLHSTSELQEIIRHEFVHVKQKHSVDIIWSEIICLINWYNPFAWLIRTAIRQNLEFIADNKVLENGFDRKQYQYLLLKVIGDNQFSIASRFNFSSLKKRIAMMNKMKSAGVHLVKFLFILPLLAVLLLAFRNNYQEQSIADNIETLRTKIRSAVFTDTVPSVKIVNTKGYFIDIKGIDGHCTVVVKDKQGKEVDRVLLNDWKEDAAKFEDKYGEILPPPPPEAPVAPVAIVDVLQPVTTVPVVDMVPPTAPVAPVPPAKPCCSECPELVSPAGEAITAIGVGIGNGIAVGKGGVIVGNGSTVSNGNGLGRIAKEWEITDKQATMTLKDGRVEKFDLTKPEQKAEFESKYGKIVRVGEALQAATVVSGYPGQTVIAPMAAKPGQGVTIIDAYDHNITGKEDVLVIITSGTTRQELDQFKAKMKEKGVELSFDNIEYNDKGKLVSISGHMKSPDGQSNFVATDFDTLYLAMVKKADDTYFKVSVKDREVI
jgi:beta-lactamase regulating signal transducer with metallopeptidase domain